MGFVATIAGAASKLNDAENSMDDTLTAIHDALGALDTAGFDGTLEDEAMEICSLLAEAKRLADRITDTHNKIRRMLEPALTAEDFV